MATIEKVNRKDGTITLNLDAAELVTITNCFHVCKKEGKDTPKLKFYRLYQDLLVAKEIVSYGGINGNLSRIFECSKLCDSRKK